MLPYGQRTFNVTRKWNKIPAYMTSPIPPACRFWVAFELQGFSPGFFCMRMHLTHCPRQSTLLEHCPPPQGSAVTGVKTAPTGSAWLPAEIREKAGALRSHISLSPPKEMQVRRRAAAGTTPCGLHVLFHHHSGVKKQKQLRKPTQFGCKNHKTWNQLSAPCSPHWYSDLAAPCWCRLHYGHQATKASS